MTKYEGKSNQTSSWKDFTSVLSCFRWPALIRPETSMTSWVLGYSCKKKLQRLLKITQAQTSLRVAQDYNGSFHNSFHPLATNTLGKKDTTDRLFKVGQRQGLKLALRDLHWQCGLAKSQYISSYPQFSEHVFTFRWDAHLLPTTKSSGEDQLRQQAWEELCKSTGMRLHCSDGYS